MHTSIARLASFTILVGAAALAACSSSTTTGGTSPGAAPNCKNPPTSGNGSAACETCESTHCASEVTDVESECTAYLPCYEACDCTDSACIEACASKQTTACTTATAATVACLETSCGTAATCGPF